MASERYLKAKNTRLKREIADIDDYLYVQGKEGNYDRTRRCRTHRM